MEARACTVRLVSFARFKAWVLGLLAKDRAPLALAFILVLDSASLPRLSFPGSLARMFSTRHYCYFPAQVWMKNVNGSLQLVSQSDNWDVTATFDPNLWQSSFWAPMTTEYRTFIGDWRRDETAVT